MPRIFGWASYTVLLLLSCQVTAASFDCKKAQTAHEKFVCADPVLNKLDAQMGQAYYKAQKNFPLPGFVLATQEWFLHQYQNCVSKDRAASQPLCADMLKARTTELEEYLNAKVYSTGKGAFNRVNDGAVLLIQRGKDSVLRYYGGWMPDGNNPRPWPEGYFCNSESALRSVDGKLAATDPNVKISISEHRISGRISCGARNGMGGEFLRVGK